MPRGNDIEGNATWEAGIHSQYGIHSNAQELINAHRASVDYAVVKALLLTRASPSFSATSKPLRVIRP